MREHNQRRANSIELQTCESVFVYICRCKAFKALRHSCMGQALTPLLLTRHRYTQKHRHTRMKAQKHTGISTMADRHTRSNTPTTLPLRPQRTRLLLWLDPYIHAHSSSHYKGWRGWWWGGGGLMLTPTHPHYANLLGLLIVQPLWKTTKENRRSIVTFFPCIFL